VMFDTPCGGPPSLCAADTVSIMRLILNFSLHDFFSDLRGSDPGAAGGPEDRR